MYLRLSFWFLFLAIVSGIIGFTEFAEYAVYIAKILTFVFTVLFLMSLFFPSEKRKEKSAMPRSISEV